MLPTQIKPVSCRLLQRMVRMEWIETWKKLGQLFQVMLYVSKNYLKNYYG